MLLLMNFYDSGPVKLWQEYQGDELSRLTGPLVLQKEEPDNQIENFLRKQQTYGSIDLKSGLSFRI
jgi:hypothetical protein